MHEHLTVPLRTRFATSKANQCAAPSLHLSGVEEDGPAPWQHPGTPGCEWESGKRN